MKTSSGLTRPPRPIARITRTLLTGTVLLGAVLAQAAGAQTAGTQATAAPDSAVISLLRDAQPGNLYTLSGSVAETCDRLTTAGLKMLGVGYSSRDQAMHVFHDAARSQYLSVLHGEKTVIRVTSDQPTARVWLWAE
ncbi:hypothetical protein [Deinococcus yunweiensis]|uniref:hypothetical protein n=1 Tax=Deinococcus yunweiensis TaxID=367282 RepID=UPI00398ED69D